MGYLKNGSQKSLLTGGVSAWLLYYVYTELPTTPILASTILVLRCICLTILRTIPVLASTILVLILAPIILQQVSTLMNSISYFLTFSK
ncbi:hypothetical protein Pint_31744 [Pistacia integerrima]|uniref:Uncharacterized protein n=1 Tax=Pistacia integerrima TaxID=434235 RepID=A0ACC0XN56_9ROSI|nr:hypothetical protein Pint_31744 [Pistacia integerrima]